MFVSIAQCDDSLHFATLEDLWLQYSRKKQDKMAKNGRFWPFFSVFFYSTVTTSILMLQNVSYHHTEQ